MRTAGAEDESRSSSAGAVDAAPDVPGRPAPGSVAGGNDDGGITGAETPGDDDPAAPDPAPSPEFDDPPRLEPSELPEPVAADPAAPAPSPGEAPPTAFMPRTLGGSAPAEGAGRSGNVPTAGMVGGAETPPGDPTAAPPTEGEAFEGADVSRLEPREPPIPAPTPGVLAEPFAPALVPTPLEALAPPACPTRGAVAAGDAAAGRAAGGVPPFRSEEGEALPLAPTPGALTPPTAAPAREGDEEEAPPAEAGEAPAAGATATRGEAMPPPAGAAAGEDAAEGTVEPAAG